MQGNALDDTIAAISTPIGQGGIGTVRLSGKEALTIADKLFVSKDGKQPSTYNTYTVHYGWIVNSRCALCAVRYAPRDKSAERTAQNAQRTAIDEVLLTVMRAPKSYTKEDIVEISCHSGLVVLREILDMVLANGARLAEPGEFTKRAFLNGRIDLSRAEAVLDIINAKTNLALKSGVRQLEGQLFSEIAVLREKLLEIIVPLEANIDFPEEDIEQVAQKRIETAINEVFREIEVLLESSGQGKILREGVSAVILGRTNVGKSSLLNALLKEERAIVTPIAGTTRDAIEEIIDIRGIPLKIADTAGIIEPRDLIEEEALKKTQSYFQKADLILLVFDASVPLKSEDKALIKKFRNRQAIAVLNKSDLKLRVDVKEVKKHFKYVAKVSCLKLTGLKDLEESIADLLLRGKLELSEETIIGNLRHIQALRKAEEELKRVKDSLKAQLSIEFAVESLKGCRNYLGQIIGENLEDGILDKIFAEFCIGK